MGSSRWARRQGSTSQVEVLGASVACCTGEMKNSKVHEPRKTGELHVVYGDTTCASVASTLTSSPVLFQQTAPSVFCRVGRPYGEASCSGLFLARAESHGGIATQGTCGLSEHGLAAAAIESRWSIGAQTPRALNVLNQCAQNGAVANYHVQVVVTTFYTNLSLTHILQVCSVPRNVPRNLSTAWCYAEYAYELAVFKKRSLQLA